MTSKGGKGKDGKASDKSVLPVISLTPSKDAEDAEVVETEAPAKAGKDADTGGKDPAPEQVAAERTDDDEADADADDTTDAGGETPPGDGVRAGDEQPPEASQSAAPAPDPDLDIDADDRTADDHRPDRTELRAAADDDLDDLVDRSTTPDVTPDEIDIAPEPEPATSPPVATTEPDTHAGGSFAAAALRTLILVLVVFALSLWLVPMLAPLLPATIAKLVMPGQQVLDERLKEIDKQISARSKTATDEVLRLRAQVAVLMKRLDAAEDAANKARDAAAAAKGEAATSAKAAKDASVARTVVEKAEGAAKTAAKAADTATTAATEAGKVAASATRDAASLARRMTAFEAQVVTLGQQVKAMGDALATVPVRKNGGPTPEFLAAFAALKAEVAGLTKQMKNAGKFLTRSEADKYVTQDDLRSARTAVLAETRSAIAKLPKPGIIVTTPDLARLRKKLDGEIGVLKGRVGGAEKTAGAARAEAAAAAMASRAAVGRVSVAIRGASLRAAIAALKSRLQNGVAFGSALEEIERLTGNPPPDELKAVSVAGVATTESLIRGFGRAANAAIRSQAAAEARGDGVVGRATARIRSVIKGRPKTEQKGDDTGAILSRVEARLREGALAAALREAETLPASARKGMSDWLARLRTRVMADNTAERYIAAIGRPG